MGDSPRHDLRRGNSEARRRGADDEDGDIVLEDVPAGVQTAEWISAWRAKHAGTVVLFTSGLADLLDTAEAIVVRAGGDRRAALEAAAALYAAGHELDWEALYGAVQRPRTRTAGDAIPADLVLG